MACNEGHLWTLCDLGIGVMEGEDEQVLLRITSFGKPQAPGFCQLQLTAKAPSKEQLRGENTQGEEMS